MDNGYEQVPVGHGRVRFTVIPARVPPARLVPLLAFAATLGLALLLVPSGMLVRLGVGTALGGWVGGRVRRASAARLERLRSPGGTFVASPDGVELPGKAAGTATLPELTVRNLLAAAGGPGRERSAAFPCSYALCFGSIPLAGGMSEAVARSLLEEVARVAGGSLRHATRPFEPRWEARAPGSSWTLACVSLAIAACMSTCQAPAPDVERIADAIQSSDWLRRLPLPDRKRLG